MASVATATAAAAAANVVATTTTTFNFLLMQNLSRYSKFSWIPKLEQDFLCQTSFLMGYT